ncbi:MAG: Fe-S protein assembly co-chaperone HscB [Sphingobacteriia bacterium]
MEDYYAFFGLPEQYGLDVAGLKQRYLAQSKALHPDYHTLADAPAQRHALEQSSLNNRAYHTLKDPLQRLAYLLQRYGLLDEQGGNTSGVELEPPFLLEVMELSEAAEEADADTAPALLSQLASLEDRAGRELVSSLTAFDQAKDGRSELLRQAMQPYLQQKYLLRIRQALRTFDPSR